MVFIIKIKSLKSMIFSTKHFYAVYKIITEILDFLSFPLKNFQGNFTLTNMIVVDT